MGITWVTGTDLRLVFQQVKLLVSGLQRHTPDVQWFHSISLPVVKRQTGCSTDRKRLSIWRTRFTRSKLARWDMALTSPLLVSPFVGFVALPWGLDGLWFVACVPLGIELISIKSWETIASDSHAFKLQFLLSEEIRGMRYLCRNSFRLCAVKSLEDGVAAVTTDSFSSRIRPIALRTLHDMAPPVALNVLNRQIRSATAFIAA